MQLMTTAVVVTSFVQTTSLVWLWASYELERIFRDIVRAGPAPRENVELLGGLFEELGLFLESLLLFTVVGTTVGMRRTDRARPRAQVYQGIADYKTYQYSHQKYLCGFPTCQQPLIDPDVGQPLRLRNENTPSTCQFSARVGNRALIDQIAGWDGHTSYFPCLAELWRLPFRRGVAAHALISCFQGHFIDKAARGKTTRWAALVKDVIL
ncbi:hypothetical protein B0H14DRAFT_910395 [Mycena olivaceomarginata]|nr:hypothetical protein B0H14DRAFT_910395 [Mycena olivaceomarginata]